MELCFDWRFVARGTFSQFAKVGVKHGRGRSRWAGGVIFRMKDAAGGGQEQRPRHRRDD